MVLELDCLRTLGDGNAKFKLVGAIESLQAIARELGVHADHSHDKDAALWHLWVAEVVHDHRARFDNLRPVVPSGDGARHSKLISGVDPARVVIVYARSILLNVHENLAVSISTSSVDLGLVEKDHRITHCQEVDREIVVFYFSLDDSAVGILRINDGARWLVEELVAHLCRLGDRRVKAILSNAELIGAEVAICTGHAYGDEAVLAAITLKGVFVACTERPPSYSHVLVECQVLDTDWLLRTRSRFKMVVVLPRWPSWTRVHNLDEENGLSIARNPCDPNIVSGRHVYLEIPIVLVPRLVDEAQVLLTELNSFPRSLLFIVVCWGRLTKRIHVIDVLPRGDQIEQLEIRPETNEILSIIVVIRVISIHSDDVIDVVHRGQEVLWVLVPHRVEEHLVEYRICYKNRCSVFLAAPPGLETIEALCVLIWKWFVDVVWVTNRSGICEELIVGCLIDISKRDANLRLHGSINAEEDRSVEPSIIAVLGERHLIDVVLTPWLIVVVVFGRIWASETHKQVGISRNGLKHNRYLLQKWLYLAVCSWVNLICCKLVILDGIVIDLVEVDVTWVVTLDLRSDSNSTVAINRVF